MAGAEPRDRRKVLVKGGIGLAVLAVAGVLVLRGFDVKSMIFSIMEIIRLLGPAAFFTAMALLPAAGFPLMAFALTAGPAFGAQLGLGGVLLGSAAAITVNVVLTYWLARRALRPLLAWALGRLGYRIPVVPASDQFEMTLLVRITPGPPFFVQSYLLGLAEIPFRTYLLPSLLFPMINLSGVVIFGDALMHGKAKVAVLGISLVVAAILGVHLLRRHLRQRRQRQEAHTS
jgi:uncharacterized membrane protein YdjX (TVP38/TMEM64 family)